MTPQQLQNKIADLEWWLRNNPNHTNRVMMEGDLRKLNYQLVEIEKKNA